MDTSERPAGNGNGGGEAAEMTIRQGGAQHVTAKTVTVRQGGIVRAQADEIEVTQGGIVLAEAKEIEVTAGCITAALADKVEIEAAMAQVVVAREQVTMDQTAALAVAAPSVTVKDSAVALLVAGRPGLPPTRLFARNRGVQHPSNGAPDALAVSGFSAERLSRRHLIKVGGLGLLGLSLPRLLQVEAISKARGRGPRAHAKSVIYLHMSGAPPSLDLFDFKPRLQELDGQKMPESMIKNERFAFIKGVPRLLGTPHTFTRHGKSGAEISSALPHLAEIADELAIVRSMKTDQFNHAPAQLFVHTGSARLGRPSMGAWMSYGLGTEGRDLPGFVVMVSGKNGPDGGASLWGSGFLPTIHQGVRLRSQGEPVLFLSNPAGVTDKMQRRTLDLIKELNQKHLGVIGDPEIATRISAYDWRIAC